MTKVPWCIVLYMPIGTPFGASLLREDLKADSQNEAETWSTQTKNG